MNKRLRHTGRQSDTHINIETDRQRERHTPPQTHTASDRGNRHTYIHTDRYTDRQTDRGGIKETLICNYYLDGCDDGLDDGWEGMLVGCDEGAQTDTQTVVTSIQVIITYQCFFYSP